jgi:hypothetical protein
MSLEEIRHVPSLEPQEPGIWRNFASILDGWIPLLQSLIISSLYGKRRSRRAEENTAMLPRA